MSRRYKILQKSYDDLFWNFFIRTLMELAIEISFYSFLNLVTIDSYANLSDSILTMTGVIGCGVALALPGIMGYLIGVNYKNLQHKNYDTLMEDIKQEESSWARFYYPLFLF